MNTSDGVASGRIWVAFQCGEIDDPASMSKCTIKQGYAIFENCLQ